jgi:hypothetical protein
MLEHCSGGRADYQALYLFEGQIEQCQLLTTEERIEGFGREGLAQPANMGCHQQIKVVIGIIIIGAIGP